ncbi:MAG: hypothetical protein L6R43_18600 [Planctomycetes bacterium]|nr:hypothetical protein [Planctomycetota bacterium]
MGLGLGLGMGMGMGMGPGLGMGPRPRAPDDKGLVKERTRGKLGPSGEINEVQTFTGLPQEGESKVALREMVQSATQEAEEALGQEEIPRRRREAVQRYFEDVKPK